jgi:predicted AAA+ superfamily ATPase
VELPLAPNEVVTVTGARRAGKTYLLFSTINKILDRGLVSHDEILYADFEDSRLRGVRALSTPLSHLHQINRRHASSRSQPTLRRWTARKIAPSTKLYQ